MRTDTISSFKSAIKILSLSDIDSVFYVFQLVISICLAARKYAGSSALAPLWKIGQLRVRPATEIGKNRLCSSA